VAPVEDTESVVNDTPVLGSVRVASTASGAAVKFSNCVPCGWRDSSVKNESETHWTRSDCTAVGAGYSIGVRW
jgi:hypothetical protein